MDSLACIVRESNRGRERERKREREREVIDAGALIDAGCKVIIGHCVSSAWDGRKSDR